MTDIQGEKAAGIRRMFAVVYGTCHTLITENMLGYFIDTIVSQEQDVCTFLTVSIMGVQWSVPVTSHQEDPGFESWIEAFMGGV